MEPWLIPMLKGLILMPITLLPIINPLSTAPIFAASVRGNDQMAAQLAR